MKLSTSPYETRQEIYRDDPWKFLMICFMLNQTSHKQVDTVRDAFFSRYPNAESMKFAKEEDVIDIIKPLGFYNKRAKSWKNFSSEWIHLTEKYDTQKPPVTEIAKLPGVGRYALDSWKVFQLYNYNIEVEDHVLVWYVEWARKEVEKLKGEQPYKPMTVFYVHVEDERGFINNWNKCRDYSCVVMARDYEEAIDKTKKIALNQENAKHIKILGFGHAKHEWVDEKSPMKSDPEYYSVRSKAALKSAKDGDILEHFSRGKKITL